jgi:hypothetical protein
MADDRGPILGDAQGIWQRGGADIENLPDPFVHGLPAEPAQTEKPRRRWLRWGFTAFGALILITLLWLIFTAPLSRALEPLDDPAMLLVSSEGRPIARRGAIKDEPVDVARLDSMTPAAFIAIEDRRFRSHWGIDPRAIGRAMLANFQAGGVRQGGSTITQQLAKTSFLSSDRSLKRKAQEVIIAFWLEGWLTKDEILSRYLSSVYFGDGVYGLRAASRHYFDREPERLTLAQSAMLAGMVQAPSRLAPTRNLALAQKRSRLVLQTMADTGVISQARAEATRSARPVGSDGSVPTGTYFADWVAPQASQAFDADYGEVRVTTTLDADLQRIAARAVANAHIGGAQAALVAMRPDGRCGGDGRRPGLWQEPLQPGQRRLAASRAARSSCSSTSLRFGPVTGRTASSKTRPSRSKAGPQAISDWHLSRPDHPCARPFARVKQMPRRSGSPKQGRAAECHSCRPRPGVDSPLIDRPSLVAWYVRCQPAGADGPPMRPWPAAATRSNRVAFR